jgi:hypothetical protein
MTEFDKQYLNLLHYPLKLENVIDKINYSPFCSDKCYQIEVVYHKSLLLYLICSGYPFEDILLEQRADTRSSPMISSICSEGEFRYIKIHNPEIFKSIAKLYPVRRFSQNNTCECFIIKEKCMEHIYHVAQETLYNISKEILYKHYLLYNTDFIPFDIISYMTNISFYLLI